MTRRSALTLVVVASLAVPLAPVGAAHAKQPRITVTQNEGEQDTGFGIACNDPGPTRESHWYRRFDLVDEHGVAKGFSVARAVVRLGTVTQEDRALPFNVAVHQIDPGDALMLANLETLGTRSVQIDEDDSSALLDLPLKAAVARGKDLVVEAWVPTLLDGEDFFLGANRRSESAPDYFSAPDCGAPEPVTVTSLGFPRTAHVLYAVGIPVECAAATKKAAGRKKAVRAAAKALAQAKRHGTRAEVARAQRVLARAEAELRSAQKKAARECKQPAFPGETS